MSLKKLFTSPLSEVVSQVLSSRRTREDILEELEEQLILADISAPLVSDLLSRVNRRAGFPFDASEFNAILHEEIRLLLDIPGTADMRLQEKKNIIMLVGINGCGKTTTAAKLAYYFRSRGLSVMMAAADTFRAAGSSQLTMWGKKLDIPVVGGDRGADPGSVVFNSLTAFASRECDLLIVDTAGRVQTRDGLMKELEKLTKIVNRQFPGQPAETLLVVDATMGQNTLDQARRFRDFSGISGMILTKVDGTAKGGTVINILHELNLPLKFAGTGEREKDLQPFSVKDFIDSLLGSETDGDH